MIKSTNRLVVVNTASNYILTLVRMISVILMTRWLFHYLGDDYYGFWSIIWAFFSYLIVFNLGFGISLQKYTAERIYEKNPDKFNKMASLIFASYIGMALIICLIAFVGAFYMSAWTNVEDEHKLKVCRVVLGIFTVGMAINFPLSIFSEMIVGLKLIYVRNIVAIFTRVAEVSGIMLVMWSDFGITRIVMVPMAASIVGSLVLGFIVKRKIPTLKFSPNLDFSVFKEIYNFSAFVYINSVATLIIAKTDRFVLSSILGLSSVGTYQIGTRLSELSQTFSSQFIDNVVPFSADLIKSGDFKKLRSILLMGMRFSAYVATGISIVFAILAEPTIKFLFNVQSSEIANICRVFLLSQFIYVAVRGVAFRYLQVSGKHKFVAYSAMWEAGLNLGLSIILCHAIGIMGVVWGTLIPNVIISCFVLFPAAFKDLKFKASELFSIFVKPLAASISIAAVCEWSYFAYGGNIAGIVPLSLTYAGAAIAYAFGGWVLILTEDEKKFILSKLKIKK